jgi:hypothetical protein
MAVLALISSRVFAFGEGTNYGNILFLISTAQNTLYSAPTCDFELRANQCASTRTQGDFSLQQLTCIRPEALGLSLAHVPGVLRNRAAHF